MLRIAMPRAAASTPVAAAATPSEEIDNSGCILLVEDEALVRNVVAEILREEGFEVLEAENGARALRVFEDNCERVDLVVSDMVMPGISGKRLAVQLLEKHDFSTVLLLSGYQGHRATELSDGRRIPILAKPFSPEELLESIGRLLGGP